MANYYLQKLWRRKRNSQCVDSLNKKRESQKELLLVSEWIGKKMGSRLSAGKKVSGALRCLRRQNTAIEDLHSGHGLVMNSCFTRRH